MARRTDLDLDLEERARLLDAWVEKRRRIAALEAEATELLIARIAIHDADVAESPHHRDAIRRAMISEYAAASRIPQGSIEYAFGDAVTLSTDLPSVRAAYARGDVTPGHVREIVRAGSIVAEAIRNKRVDPEVMSLYETSVLVVAEHETAARTGAHARQVASALVGDTVVERHRRAADERCVRVRSLDDGLALLTAVLPEWLAVAIHDRLTQMTRQVMRTRDDREPVLDPWSFDEHGYPSEHSDVEAPGGVDAARIFGEGESTFALDPDVEHVGSDERTWDRVQADLLTDLLLTADPSAVQGEGLGAIRGRIQVTVAATTLAGIDDRPAELDGHGPLHPDIARVLAGRDGGWTRLFLDSTGMVTETDAYSPTEAMRRFLRARDQHCRFPGCRMPAHRCDIDHTWDHARGGPTRTDNLGHLCRGHHVLKHPDVPEPHRWTAQQFQDGTITWFSPLGRSYPDGPRRRVMFV